MNPLTTLQKMIEQVARPEWERLIVETPEVLEDGMTFKDFCDELKLELP